MSMNLSFLWGQELDLKISAYLKGRFAGTSVCPWIRFEKELHGHFSSEDLAGKFRHWGQRGHVSESVSVCLHCLCYALLRPWARPTASSSFVLVLFVFSSTAAVGRTIGNSVSSVVGPCLSPCSPPPMSSFALEVGCRRLLCDPGQDPENPMCEKAVMANISKARRGIHSSLVLFCALSASFVKVQPAAAANSAIDHCWNCSVLSAAVG